MFRITSLARNYTTSYSGLSKEIWFGIFVGFIQSVCAGIFYFLSYYFVTRLNYSPKVAGAIISFYGIGAIFGGLLGGKFSDVIGSKIISYYSLIGQAFVFLSLSIVHSPFLLSICSFFFGVTNYSFITSNNLWILSYCEEGTKIKLRTINILAVVSNLGMSITAIYIPFIPLEKFDYLFSLNFFALIILGFFVYLQKNEYLRKQVLSKLENVTAVVNTKKSKLVFNGILLITYSAVFFIGMIISQMSATYSLYLKDSFPQYGISSFSFLFTLNTLLVVFLQTPTGEFLNKKNPMLSLGLGCLLIGIGMGLLPICAFIFLVIIACVIYTFGEMIFFSLAQLICYEKASDERKGIQLGIFRMIYALSRVFGPLFGGIIYTNYNGNYIWCLAFFIGLVFSIICYKYNDV